jgi:hypothetical protein
MAIWIASENAQWRRWIAVDIGGTNVDAFGILLSLFSLRIR